MDNDVQKSGENAFQWRVLALEQAKQDHELRLREVERNMSTMSEKVENVDKKIDTILTKIDEATNGKLTQYSSVALTVAAVVLAAILEHFWK